jgi:MFS family permease
LDALVTAEPPRPHRHSPLRWFGSRLRQSVARFTAGGRWTDRLPASIRRNLRWFWLDGVFAQASESIVLAYLSLYLLALGATAAQIGLMSALSNLSAALLLLPGAAIVERWGRRKPICLLAGGGVARGTLLLLAFLPMFFDGQTAIYVSIALAVTRIAFANLSVPAWTSLTAALVPLRWRGRYFSSRNVAMGVAGMSAAFCVGQLITRVGAPAGYQLALGLAFVLGLISTLSFARIAEPSVAPAPPSGASRRRLPLWQNLRRNPAFLAFCGVAALWNFSLGIAGPFFSVYLVSTLKASVGFVGFLGVVNGLTALPGQRLSGILSDRWGPRQVQLITGLLIPLVPWLWALSRSPWHLVPAELASGFLWAGYGLSSFNFLLTLSPEERRARYAALYQLIVTVTLAVGAAVGSGVATAWGYRATFVLSGVGRLSAALLFARLVRQPASSPA